MFLRLTLFTLSRYRVPEVMTSTLSLATFPLPSLSFPRVSTKRRSVNIYGFVFPDGPILFELQVERDPRGIVCRIFRAYIPEVTGTKRERRGGGRGS